MRFTIKQFTTSKGLNKNVNKCYLLSILFLFILNNLISQC